MKLMGEEAKTRPLTVKELIMALMKCPPDALVVTVSGDMGEGYAKRVDAVRAVPVKVGHAVGDARTDWHVSQFDPSVDESQAVPAVFISPYPDWYEEK